MSTRIQGQLIPKMGISKSLGIDLGTANTLVFLRGKGIVVQEPSVVAIKVRTGEIVAVGNEAKEMIGRTPANITAIKPLKQGVISDFNTTKIMLKYFINKALKGRGLFRPRVLVSVPLDVSQIEKRAIIEASKQAGAKDAYVIEETVAGAMGAGLPVDTPTGIMVVDIGGGTTDVAIISMGGIVNGASLKIGGDEINTYIWKYMRKAYNLDIGETTAERVKVEVGYAIDPPENKVYSVKGRNIATGLPVKIDVSAVEITTAIQEPLQKMLETTQGILEKTPAELASDIMDRGLILFGGGALLKHIDRYFQKYVNVPVFIAEDPLTCVVKGTGKALESLSTIEKIFLSK